YISRRGLFKGSSWSKQTGSTQQQKCPCLWPHRFNFDLASKSSHYLCSCRQEKMPLESWRNEILDHGQFIGIVEDEQPFRTPCQPGSDSLDCYHLVLFILLW